MASLSDLSFSDLSSSGPPSSGPSSSGPPSSGPSSSGPSSSGPSSSGPSSSGPSSSGPSSCLISGRTSPRFSNSFLHSGVFKCSLSLVILLPAKLISPVLHSNTSVPHLRHFIFLST
ncbi:hypothetical protein B0T20DRAFT_87286 [Sordaria brevicollis]|uniref:Uncharacterized protein n=1 Tax=Sordaria brevicollis TaxID=83679 RepID=A0AAE0NWB7_SORBR|nr:hypothetical protein B0T20DRAFT_87286 [Sordaria brevicollis]